jgi:hypothetical protein
MELMKHSWVYIKILSKNMHAEIKEEYACLNTEPQSDLEQGANQLTNQIR